DACQEVVDCGWNKSGLKTYNKNKLHDRTYQDVRKKSDLPANLVIRARDRASEAIKGCVEKLKNEKKASKPEFTSDSIAYDKRTLTVWLDERKCSFSTIDGRIKTDFAIPEELNDYYEKYFDDGWQVCQSTIEKHEYEDGEPYYLHLGLEKETPENNSPNPTVMGVDLGVENLAVTSTGEFFSGTRLFHKRERFEEIRGELQAKGTRSAHLTIQKMSGRENRFACDTLHRVSKRIVQEAVEKSVDVIVFENLEEIREDISNGKKFQSWAFRKLKEYVEYKAEEQGIEVRTVSPKYTSQRCSKCGNTQRENRDGQHFRCRDCGYRADSDYNASKNIGMKVVLGGQKSRSRMGNGQLALKSGVLKPNGNYFPTHSG
ncbi:hypothetical protein AKJ52_02300, partial [candidate division MSBL1 archaeon SCGC-AAA382C18]